MAAVLTYTTLSDLIKAYANRTDAFFTEQIPYFIENGQYRIVQDAKDQGEIRRVTGQFTANNPILVMPDGWSETSVFSYTINDAEQVLQARSYDFCISYWPTITDTAAPMFYATFGGPDVVNKPNGYASFYIAPTPSEAYNYTLVYKSYSPSLIVQDDNVNWISERYPNLLLYACMIEAMNFTREDQRVQVFQALYDRVLNTINTQTINRHTDLSSKRDTM